MYEYGVEYVQSKWNRHYCNNFIVTHGVENVKLVVLLSTLVCVPGN